MVNTSYSQQNYTGFDFSMRTSSGDEINLSAYKDSQVALETKKSNTMHSTAVSLREAFGLSFSYEGNGIDAQDQKEIDAALKKIKPILNILNPKNTFHATDKSVSNTAFDINTLLPTAKDENHQNFMKDNLVTQMDEMLKAFEANDEMLQLARDVFDALDEQMKGLNFYA